MAEAALLAEFITAVDRDGQVAAIRRALVLTGCRAKLHLAGDVIAQPAVADLAIDPGIVAIPAGKQAQRGVVLGEITLAVAKVRVHAAVTGKATDHHAIARPIHAEQTGRSHAVIQVGVRIALHVTPQVAPPAQAIGRTPRQVAAHLVGTGTARGLCRVAQDLLQAGGLQHRNGVLAEDLVRGRARVHAVGKHVGIGRIGGCQRQRRAHQRRCRGTGHVADIGEAISARRGNDLLQDGEGIHRDHLQAGLLQAAEQRIVIGLGQRRALRHANRAASARGRGQADIGQVGHHHVLRTGALQGTHDTHLVGHGCTDGSRSGCTGGHREQVVGATPDGIQRIGVGLAAIGRQVAGHLRLQRGHGLRRRTGCQGDTAVHADTGTANSVVVTALAIAVRHCIGAVMIRQIVRPHPTRVGGEAADQCGIGIQLHQHRAEMTGVGQAVTKENRLGERRLGKRRNGSQRQGHSDSAAQRTEGKRHGGTPEVGKHRRHTPPHVVMVSLPRKRHTLRCDMAGRRAGLLRWHWTECSHEHPAQRRTAPTPRPPLPD